MVVVACASADDDSWNGAAGEELQGSEGGGGSQDPIGGAPSDGGNHSSNGGAPSGAGSGTTTVTSGSTSTTGGGSCDLGSCDSCQSCAMEGLCAASVDACFNDTECYSLLECLSACADDTCFQSCANSYPSAMPLYNAVGECIYCDACLSSCGGC